MALTVDTLRNLTGTGSITLDRQNDGLVAGTHQSFRGFFNIGDREWAVAHPLPAAAEVRDVLPGIYLGQKSDLAFTLRPHACKVLLLKPTAR